ncbi:MAG: hypothetical protein HFE98_00155 [Ruminiclostridium sp.]|nr:hypothetical protein [Ruminiclostridium sp.]MCI9465828.1 hypothetical protein [Ruminiclostridium sp.]
MTISEKVAYLKGLADGLDLDLENSKEGKLLVKIIDILEDLGLAVEDLEVEVQAAGDELEALAEDVADVETMLFDELDEDDEDLFDLDDFFEIECPSCGEDIIIDESVLDVGEVVCPNCGDSFSLDLVVEDEEKDGDED